VTLSVERASDRPPTAIRVEDLGDVLFLTDVAAVLRTSTRTIKRHLRAGTFPIPSLPGIDKRVRFARVDVARYLRRERAR
jgi:predicted site-specific integrase-resolvase